MIIKITNQATHPLLFVHTSVSYPLFKQPQLMDRMHSLAHMQDKERSAR